VNADRNDCEFVGWHTKQPTEDVGEEGADHNDPVDALMEQWSGGPPPGDT
jgi:hypothetical protein